MTSIESLKRIGDHPSEPILLDILPIRFGGGGEARRHLDAVFAKAANHLAKRGIFPADARDIATTDVVEPENLRRLCEHGMLPIEAGAYKRVRRRGALIWIRLNLRALGSAAHAVAPGS